MRKDTNRGLLVSNYKIVHNENCEFLVRITAYEGACHIECETWVAGELYGSSLGPYDSLGEAQDALPGVASLLVLEAFPVRDAPQ